MPSRALLAAGGGRCPEDFGHRLGRDEMVNGKLELSSFSHVTPEFIEAHASLVAVLLLIVVARWLRAPAVVQCRGCGVNRC